MGNKKAYTVHAEEESVVVFSHTSVVARRNGANALNIEFEEVQSCLRSPDFDKFHWVGKVPAKELLYAGWWWSCHCCGGHVTVDENPDYYISHKDEIYCDFACYDRETKKQIKDKIIELRGVRKTKKKFPFAQEIRTCTKCLQGGEVAASAYFRYSDKAVSSADWEMDSDVVSVSKCDLDIWTEVKAGQETLK